MGECDICDGDEKLPYTCNECGGQFCSEHRLPEAHRCQALISKEQPEWFDDDLSTRRNRRSQRINRRGGQTNETEEVDKRDDQEESTSIESAANSESMSNEDAQDNKSSSKNDSSTATSLETCRKCSRSTMRNCDQCGGKFCDRHRHPADHNCPSLNESNNEDAGESHQSIPSIRNAVWYARQALSLGIIILLVPLGVLIWVLSWTRSHWKLCFLLVAVVGIGGLNATGNLDSAIEEGDSIASDLGNATDTSLNETRVEVLVHEGINDARANHSRSRLSHDPELRRIASKYSQRMATEGFYSHTDPQGQTFEDRYANAGYSCRVPISSTRYATGAENILYTYAFTDVRTEDGVEEYDTERELADAIVESWMNSEGHRENILRSYWQNEGIGVAIIDNPGGDGKKVYATQNFC